MRNLRWAAAVFFLLAAAGNSAAQDADAAAALSRMDKTLIAAEEDFTLRDAYYTGRAAAARILERYRPYNENPALTRYLNMICGALAVNSSAPDWYDGYHVMLLDSPVLNAFSTSGGHIFITRGLAEAAVSEDMLAAIIAHELAHIQLWHGIENIRHDRLVQDLKNTANAAARAAAREAAIDERTLLFQESVAGTVNTLLQNGYSQAQELDADSHALSLLAAAGYDPQSFPELLRLLERGPGGFGTTHPLPARRIAAVERNLAASQRAASQYGSYRVTDTRAFRRERFLRAMNRLR